MPLWWEPAPKSEPEPEQPEEKEPVSATEIQPAQLTEEDKRKAWRLLCLLDALLFLRPSDPVSLDEIDLLGRVAKGHDDLHDACAALRNGCSLDYLVLIFT